MLFMSDTRNGIARTLVRSEREEVAAQWTALMQTEADNFESVPSWQTDDRWLLNVEHARLVA